MSQSRHKDDAPTFIALFFILILTFGLIALTAMVLPQIAGIAIVGGGFLFLCAFHYLVWGQFMKAQPEEDSIDGPAEIKKAEPPN